MYVCIYLYMYLQTVFIEVKLALLVSSIIKALLIQFLFPLFLQIRWTHQPVPVRRGTQFQNRKKKRSNMLKFVELKSGLHTGLLNK